MIAGRLRDKVTVYRPVEEVNGYGEAMQTWVAVATVHAERSKRVDARSEQVGEHFAEARVTWLIRGVHAVKANWRIVDARTGEKFTIMAVTPHRERGYNELSCTLYND